MELTQAPKDTSLSEGLEPENCVTIYGKVFADEIHLKLLRRLSWVFQVGLNVVTDVLIRKKQKEITPTEEQEMCRW